MREPPTIVRQYPYRSNLAFVTFFTAFTGVLLAFGARPMLADDRDILINGCLPLSGGWATGFRWACAAGIAVVFAWTQVLFWQRVLWPGRRIALTPDGILLPRRRTAVREAYLPYAAVTGVSFEAYHDEVTFAHLDGPLGRFSIARADLPKGALPELMAAVIERVRDARRATGAVPTGSIASPPGPAPVPYRPPA